MIRVLSFFMTVSFLIFVAAGVVYAAESPSTALLLYLKKGGGDPLIVKNFIEYGADVNYSDKKDRITPLHMTLHYNHAAASKLLISLGSDINAKNEEGNAPLFIAVHQKFMELVVILLDKGADINAKNIYGYTPLSEACRWGNIELIKLLISKGADIKTVDKKGRTPLHEAAMEGNADAIKLLLELKADVNARDSYGYTPLHKAVSRGQPVIVKIVKLLLDSGANALIKNNSNRTPRDDAEKYQLVRIFFTNEEIDNNEKIIELLKDAEQSRIKI